MHIFLKSIYFTLSYNFCKTEMRTLIKFSYNIHLRKNYSQGSRVGKLYLHPRNKITHHNYN